MAQKSMAFCLPWIPHILNVHCIPSKFDLGIEAYCWQSRTAGGLGENWKIAARLQNRCNPFRGVSLQALVLYSCAGRKYRELQDGIVKVRFRKKVEEPSDDTNVRNSVSQHVFQWLRKASMLSKNFLVHLAWHATFDQGSGKPRPQTPWAAWSRTDLPGPIAWQLPHDLLPTSSSEIVCILLL